MIDNYPNNRNDYDAGFAAADSELRNIREQQENFYYRDEALKSEEIIKKAPKVESGSISHNRDIDFLGAQQLNILAINSYKTDNQTEYKPVDTQGCFGMIFAMTILAFFAYMGILILKSIA